MLSLEQARRLLGPRVQLSDEQLSQLLLEMRVVADVTLDNYLGVKDQRKAKAS